MNRLIGKPTEKEKKHLNCLFINLFISRLFEIKSLTITSCYRASKDIITTTLYLFANFENVKFFLSAPCFFVFLTLKKLILLKVKDFLLLVLEKDSHKESVFLF